MLDYTPATVALLAILSNGNSHVPVRHKVGRYTRYIKTPINATESRETPDLTSLTHEFAIPVADISVRQGMNAGGAFQHVVVKSRGPWYDIIRATGGLVDIEIVLPEAVTKTQVMKLSSGTIITLLPGQTVVKHTVHEATKLIHTGKLENLGVVVIDDVIVDAAKYQVSYTVTDIGHLAMGDRSLPTWMS